MNSGWVDSGWASADARVLEVLDQARITEHDYHDSNFARPLVSTIVHYAQRYAPSQSRTLLVGSGWLLRRTLAEMGHAVAAWEVAQAAEANPEQPTLILAGRDGATVRFPDKDGERGEPHPNPPQTGREQSLRWGGDHAVAYDLIVLPMVLELVDGDLRLLLAELRERLAPNGGLIVVATNLFKLGTRWRALLGNDFLPMPHATKELRAGNWHTVAPRRFHSAQELATYAAQSGFVVRDSIYTVGYHAYDEQRPLGVLGWVKALVRYQMRATIPSCRDYICTYWSRES